SECGGKAEKLRRLAEVVRQLALDVAGPDDVSEPLAGSDVERERVGGRLPRAADAEGAREARRGRGGTAAEVRTEAGGAAGASPPLATVGREGEGAGVVAVDSERPADR